MLSMPGVGGRLYWKPRLLESKSGSDGARDLGKLCQAAL